MSVSFLILSAVLYGLCHWVARATKPTSSPFKPQGTLRVEKDITETRSHILQWLGHQKGISILSDNDRELTGSSHQSLLSFGFYITFYLRANNQITEVDFYWQPKLVSPGSDHLPLIENLKKSLGK